MTTIDSHHHFWRYSEQEFDWINDSMRAIRRDFLADELRQTIAPPGVTGVISVQARQSLAETAWLLFLAERNDFIQGVIGWAPLRSPEITADLERFANYKKLKGVRHVLQGEPDSYMADADFNRGITALKDFGLRYDVLIVERQLPAAIQFVDRHPEQTFILDHIAKPRIAAQELEPWEKNIRALAERPNVYCKISGMVTEADFMKWAPGDLKPYFDTVLDAFGPQRLMFGSDWPVCLVACTYAKWHEVVSEWIAPLSETERQRILSGTAIEAYNVQPAAKK